MLKEITPARKSDEFFFPMILLLLLFPLKKEAHVCTT